MRLVFKPDPNNKFGAIREIASIKFSKEYGAIIATGNTFSRRDGTVVVDTGFDVYLTNNGCVVNRSYCKTMDELIESLSALKILFNK